MLNHPRNNALVGIVKIFSEDTPSFEVKLDREGFVENEAYTRLIEVIRLSLQWMVLHYNRFLSLKMDATLTEAREELEVKTKLTPNFGEEAVLNSKPLVEKAINVLQLERKKNLIKFARTSQEGIRGDLQYSSRCNSTILQS